MFEKDIVCALSGGGFRATFFHAGVLRCLVRLGLKDNIKVISSVSGGSITNGLFGLVYDEIKTVEDFDRLVVAPLITFTKLNPRKLLLRYRFLATVKRTLGRLANVMGGAGNILSLYAAQQNSEVFAEQLDLLLFEGRTLNNLSKNVRCIFNATNLNNGARFRFDNVDFGDYKIGYSYDINHIKVSDAVTASACFPALFSPMKLDLRGRKFFLRNAKKEDSSSPSYAPDLIHLSDGGIFDNLGYFSIDSEIKRGKNAFVVIGDASNRFAHNNYTYSFFNSALRINNILMEQVSNRDRRSIMQQLNSGTWPGIYFKLENSCRSYREVEPGRGAAGSLLPQIGWSDSVVSLLARVRTDLNEFSDLEVQGLIAHGDTVTETNIARWHHDTYQRCVRSAKYSPAALPAEESDLIEALQVSHKVFRF